MENQFKFTRPLDYELKANGDLIVSLDISNTEKDLVKDIVTPNFLKSMESQIKERNLKLDLEHEAFRGNTIEEKEINKTKIPAGRMMNPSIRQYTNEKGENHQALNVKALVNKFNRDYEIIKGNVLNKTLDAASIAFMPTKVKSVGETRVLDEGVLLNVALTGNPINTGAQVRNIISKSISSLAEYKAEKEVNPEIEQKLVVKASPQERRTQARNEAISEDEEEEEGEETKKKKKTEVYKAYEKDGAHAHTEEEPLGLHNHPEIENQIRMQVEHLHDRLNSLMDRFIETIDGSPSKTASEVMAIKSELIETKPFAGFQNFAECVRKNKDKKDPEAFCAAIKRKVEGKGFATNNNDKFFRDGKEIDPKTGEELPIELDLDHKSHSSQDDPIKSNGGKIMEKNIEKKDEVVEAPEEKKEESGVEAKALNGKVDVLEEDMKEIKSSLATITKALSKPINSAIEETKSVIPEVKSRYNSVLQLC